MDGVALLPEFDQEFAETRRALERVPEERFSWKPHEKSYSLHELAAHLAEIPRWAGATLDSDVFDLDAPYDRVVPQSREEILAHFDSGVAEARGKIEATSADELDGIWSMKKGGEVVFSMPKGAVLRSFVLNHNVHHRAQLGVYLRLLDVAVPGHYGPSADEQ
jgi:uncharacterized damage-inducible protein DinB